MENDLQKRQQKCLALGIGSLVKAHEIIAEGVSKGPQGLLKRGINARTLRELGYDESGLKRLGYSREALRKLGFLPEPARPGNAPVQPTAKDAPHGRTGEVNLIEEARELILAGASSGEIKRRGIAIHHCRLAGASARDLYRLGYAVDELVTEFSLREIRLLGLNPREMSRYVPGNELRNLGYSASEMRCAGYSVRDLLNFGYNDNLIIAAGYSTNDLMREGLARQTSDRDKMQHS